VPLSELHLTLADRHEHEIPRQEIHRDPKVSTKSEGHIVPTCSIPHGPVRVVQRAELSYNRRGAEEEWGGQESKEVEHLLHLQSVQTPTYNVPSME
jgi:hypothetical protein